MYAESLNAYKNVQKTTMTGRELEAVILTKAARKLKDCQDNWTETNNCPEELLESLKYNQMIWSIFQSELANNNNPLPRKLREDILSLGIFIDKRILEIIASPSKEKLSIIININMSLAAGLIGSSAAGSTN